MPEAEIMEKGSKKKRLSVLLGVLRSMKHFFRLCSRRISDRSAVSEVHASFIDRLNSADQDIQVLINSVQEAIDKRGTKIDAPSLDAVMDSVMAIHCLAEMCYDPDGSQTVHKETIREIEQESKKYTRWLNRSYRYLSDYITL